MCIIKEYYEAANVPSELINEKMEKFQNNPDIGMEFETWIKTRIYVDDGIEVEGYTAKSIAAMSKNVDGEAAFLILIELRENPNKAKNRISRGFKKK